MLVENFTVLENVILGAEGEALLKNSISKARSELRRLEQEYGLEVDPDAIIEELPVGLQQRVEILKALYRGAEILILDEPTGVLTPAEADHLFRILKQLKDQGKTVVLITHKLREIMAITDNVSVMRQGTMVATRKTSETTVEELAELMVGRRVLLRVGKGETNPGDVALKLADPEGKLSWRNIGALRLADVKEGQGDPIKEGETAVVHYTGYLVNGTVFDSSRDKPNPFRFKLATGSVIKGWDQGVLGMKVGGVRKLIIPPDLGYGAASVGAIPPNSTLVFEVELVQIIRE